ncbi:MAG: glyoxylase-like metal-dependent hydrolase (beta-lactamase superfamily II) [Granulosicoccus sp.]|jgi:glyoxylase-like metal-dependent hydrolase (beta-lactamase superfamily II)
MKTDTDLNSLQPLVKGFFDKRSNTVSYIVQDPQSSSCAVIDSVLDFDYAAGRMTYDSADELIQYIRENSLTLEWLIETHVHADHLSAAPYIQQQLNAGLVGIGEQIVEVQDVFGKVFNEGTEFERDGSQFDRLFHDEDIYRIGNLEVRVMHTPGHTPACMTHVVGNAAFVGDTLFMPDGGTARADFPGGDARTLYESIQRVLSLPDDTRLFICHDYGPNGRDIRWETSVGEEKKHNIHVGVGKSVDEFVALREERDKTLSMPSLIIPALQVNMRAGKLPEADEDGNRYLKVPVNLL